MARAGGRNAQIYNLFAQGQTRQKANLSKPYATQNQLLNIAKSKESMKRVLGWGVGNEASIPQMHPMLLPNPHPGLQDLATETSSHGVLVMGIGGYWWVLGGIGGYWSQLWKDRRHQGCPKPGREQLPEKRRILGKGIGVAPQNVL